MGDFIASRTGVRSAAKSLALPLALLVLLSATLLTGCGSSGGGEPSSLPSAGAPEGAVSSARVVTPAEIRNLELQPEAEGASLLLTADRAPVWTTYRDAEGRLVVELPNSRPTASVDSISSTDGLVARVAVEVLEDADRPLTRLVLSTRAESEHALTSEGDSLTIQLLPVGGAAVAPPAAVAYEPLPDEEDLEPQTQVAEVQVDEVPPAAAESYASASPGTASAPQADYGTPEAPYVGPAPSGSQASRLLTVDTRRESDQLLVEIIGDGGFSYSTFRLEEPERFVIDLKGVVNLSDRSALTVDDPSVRQIRVGQFKPRPEPVSRVVFDLEYFSAPTIVATGDSLRLLFSGSQQVASNEPPTPVVTATLAPPPEPSTPTEVPAEEPVTIAEQQTPAAQLPTAEEEAPSAFETATEVADSGQDESTPVWQPEEEPEIVRAQAAPPAAAPVPVYEPPQAQQPVAASDVALFEAQDVQVDSAPEEEQPLLTQFDSLVVSRNERQYVGEPISMSLRNADLVETLRTFARISGLNFVIQPGVRGSVTVELTDVPWDQAMEQVLKINKLGMEIDGSIVRIAPMNQLRAEAEEQRRLQQARAATIPLRTVMRSISYASANEVAGLLRSRTGSLLSQRGSVQVDRRTNTLIIRELPDAVDTVLAVIDNLDTPEPQVTIEARIVEANKTFARTLGIEWGYTGVANPESGNTTGLAFPNRVDSEGGVALLTGGANGFLDLTLGNILNTFSLDARLQVAENEGLVNVISAPRITTLNNERASIQSGLQIPIQVVSNRTVTVQFVNATLQLAVTPHVTAEGTILLDINVAKREPQLAFAVVGATNAPISTKEARTRVIVRDGGTAVIGGIYEVSTNHNQDRVPGLANVPILKHLFKNNSRDDSNEELMIFITPRIVQL